MPRKTPPVWLLLIWALLAVAAGYLCLADLGDVGYRNLGLLAASFVAIGFGALWFMGARAYRWRTRLSVMVVTIGALALAATRLEVDGVSGDLIPTIRLRRDPPALPTRATSTRVVDLETRTPDDFPGFLGPQRDARVPHVKLATDWDSAPQELWRRAVGDSWSSFAVVNGTAVTMEQREDQELVSAYDVESGELLWAHAAPGRFENTLGDDGPRSTPTIAGGRVFAVGAYAELRCLDGRDGSLLWRRDLLSDQGVTPKIESVNVEYGRANSPLVVDDVVIVALGGDRGARLSGLAAYDVATGEPRWEGPPRQISYASPALGELCGVRQVLIVNRNSVTGHDLADGALLWEVEWDSPNPSVSQAVPLPGDRVLVSKGYGTGAALLQLARDDTGTWSAEPIWRERRALRTKFTNVVVKGDHVYGLSDGVLECVALSDGRRAWKEGRFGHGQVLRVGEHLLVLTEEGEVVLHDLDPAEPRVLGRFQALDGKCWSGPALYGNVLLVRNANEAAAFRLPLRN